MSAIYAGVDLGGTKIAVGLAGADGKLIADRTAPTESNEGPNAVLARIANLVQEAAREKNVRIAAVGIGVPGLVDMARGTTRFLPNMPTQWRDVPVRDVLKSKLGCDVFLLNDARAATLGELVFGHGRGKKSMVYFTLGTGIGGGLVIDGKLCLGRLGSVGELGHMTIIPDGPPCGCGSRGCLETLCSGPAITGEGVRLLRSGQAPKLHAIVSGNHLAVTPATMAQAAKAGDDLVGLAITRAGEFLGIGVANAITMVHPELVVFSGGVAELGDIILEPVRQTVRKRVKMVPVDDILFLQSEIREKAGVMGGLATAMQAGIAAA